MLAFVTIVMAAVLAVTAPVHLGASPTYLTVLTPIFQWVPFATIALLHVLLTRRDRHGSAVDHEKLCTLARASIRGHWRSIIHWCLLALGLLLATSTVPLVVAAALGFVQLRWVDGAGLAALLTLPVALVFMLPVAGEELAWRGYITTLLSPAGFARTTMIITAIWVTWHLPLMLALAYAGEMDTRDVLAKSVDLILASVLLSALRYLSDSVWPAVFAHALFNNLFQMVQYNFMTPLRDANAAHYWGYMACSWAAWLAVDVLLVRLLMGHGRDHNHHDQQDYLPL
ncbi:CPBP family intramembrane glutamic endopeptidase [Luteococcus sanguinis]|uniref:CPBP family intramembrane glutamic endopeptidase n=1 Tax=Luteococcus sanguinis TaxID=174038 RepID=A0ABW1X4Z3_9ACTN